MTKLERSLRALRCLNSAPSRGGYKDDRDGWAIDEIEEIDGSGGYMRDLERNDVEQHGQRRGRNSQAVKP